MKMAIFQQQGFMKVQRKDNVLINTYTDNLLMLTHRQVIIIISRLYTFKKGLPSSRRQASVFWAAYFRFRRPRAACESLVIASEIFPLSWNLVHCPYSSRRDPALSAYDCCNVRRIQQVVVDFSFVPPPPVLPSENLPVK